jgi:hypothetical protein
MLCGKGVALFHAVRAPSKPFDLKDQLLFMDTPISKLRVWQIWKELKHLTVSAVCEDSSTGARVDEFCQRLLRDLGQHCEIKKGMWLLGELRTPQLRSIGAGEAAQAHLVIISVHHAESLPDEVEGWIDLWLKHKGNPNGAVLLALFDPLYKGSSSSMQARLQEVAKKGNMEFVVQSEEAPENL